MTIDYMFSDMPDSVLSNQQKLYLKKLISVAFMYFSKLIKVYPIIGNNILRSSIADCNKAVIPDQDRTIGIPNSDFHFYSTYFNDSNVNIIASAGSCFFSKIEKRPTFARIKYNLAFINFQGDAQVFRSNLQTILHEFIHALGFAEGYIRYWIDPDTGNSYEKDTNKIIKTVKVRGIDSIVLYSKQVLRITRKHYNCPTAEGMLLENNGMNSASNGSHWEKTIIANEIMCGSGFGNLRTITMFTVSLLRDTGFYPLIDQNFAGITAWGRNKGCNFLTSNCQNPPLYPEFSIPDLKYTCTFDKTALGVSNISSMFDTQCYSVTGYSTWTCTIESNKSSGSDKRYEYFGFDSRCFQSTSSQGQQIQIIQNDIRGGYLTCPNDLSEYCNNTKQCQNDYCSYNGICINGFCICISGYGGIDCSIVCSEAVQDNKCITQCPIGTFQGPDNVCRNFCPQSYFKQGQQCISCHPICQECTGSSPNECTACNFAECYFEENTCVEKCSPNMFLNPDNQSLQFRCIL
ncbi:leishmanolysin family protein, putative [Ichthyophthirius multifiliis]|uniref:Leishmanolysin family protein, putative n=1 Tax=Ichthyophthirius multifiliis TaxID=5932 RepID=G0QWT0_ICHMU|nr:leishmanolysin family protein, putative [Ichthyophthirius multifiliis]EGR30319.1 leishmanolysin family protein, putative [Ichthyophthirius multifiliis]|eukprot:XP_004031906.1 leishmanolysin family protein, putative [Ichthyophthirius multifiliis]